MNESCSERAGSASASTFSRAVRLHRPRRHFRAVVPTGSDPERARKEDDLERKLRLLLDHPEIVRGYEEKCRTHVVERFSWDRIVDQTESIYREITGKR